MSIQLLFSLLFLALLLIGCRDAAPDPEASASSNSSPDPCAVALTVRPDTAVEKETPEDRQIARLQGEVRTAGDSGGALERLGWTYVAKARVSYDPGWYKLAEQTSLCLEARRPGSPEALLLRGHVYHNLHRFKEGEALARELVSKRGAAFDYGLLGDMLMEQGKLEEAIPAYQKMADLKPGLQSYSRAAHMRWLKGDLTGAIELMQMAVQAGSPRTREALAWAQTRLALYRLQAADVQGAFEACDAALELQPDYAPALLARGQVLLSQSRTDEAVEPLRRAALQNPLPEYQWALAEALRAKGDVQAAEAVEERLAARGAVEDPRTFALYLATRGEDVEMALKLSREELARRADVLTLDVLAWSLAAAGKTREASDHIERALAEGTQDARLFYHAGVIAKMAGRERDAKRWLERADAIRQMLLPGERQQLSRRLATLGGDGGGEVTKLSDRR